MKDDTYTLITKLQCLMSDMLQNEMAKIGLAGFTPSYGKIFLAFQSNTTLSMKEIATFINKTPQTVTTLIANLEKQGFVEVKQCTADKRTRFATITQKGIDLLPHFDSSSDLLYKMQYKNIQSDDIVAFRKTLFQMIENFS